MRTTPSQLHLILQTTLGTDPVMSLTYFPEDAWHGELRVEANHAGFSGKADAWFNADALRQFIEPLKAWPPKLDVPVTLQSGYFSESTTSSEPVETHVRISIGQRGGKGRHWVEALLTEPDDEILPQSAIVRFFVEPAALVRFADDVEAMLASGGTVTLLASGGGTADPATVTLPCAITRPYTPLFIESREACSALVEQMDAEVVGQIRAALGPETAISWQATSPHVLLARIDWEHGSLNLAWAGWDAASPDRKTLDRAHWSPVYPLDLSALKHAARTTAHPRAWFETYALYILSIAQDYLGEFLRDGPTDDIPYQRHLIYALGTARIPEPVWVKRVLFKCDDL